MKRLLLFSGILLLAGFASQAQDEARLMRFPTIHGDQVVFSYAGDLFTASTSGGIARRLTSGDGYEMFAKFSPDGNTIGFTGQYDGNTEIFTIPKDGGNPQRLTFTATLGRDDVSDRMGPNNIVMAWTPDGKSIIYRSRKKTFNDFVGQLFQVSKEGGLSAELPLPSGGNCSYSPDGKQLAYNKVFREFRTWKYYQGGMADDVWMYDFASKKTINITQNKAQDIFPMWYKEEIYFLSDRDRTMNLFAYNTKTKATRKVSNFTEYDIKFPSICGNQIIFENGGFLYVFNTDTQVQKKLSIQIKDDFEYSRDRLMDASSSITAASPSPGGERLALAARGEIFNAPAKEGITQNLTQTSGAHDRDVQWSPDGKYIAWISDKNGEFEIYMQKQDGSEPAVQLTKDADTYYYGFSWSPDSKKILWSDRKFRLRYLDIESKKITEVYTSKIFEMRDFDWSPDSKWIAFSRPEENAMSKICLYELASGKITEVTDGWYNSSSPNFSIDGKYLLFESDREFNPIYSQTEWNHAYVDMGKLYMLTLSSKTVSPFSPKNDVLKEEKSEEKADEKAADSSKKAGKGKEEKSEKADATKDVVVDLDGIQQRIIALPLKSGSYYNILCINDKVYYNYYQSSAGKAKWMMYDLEEEKETELGEGTSFQLTANQKKMLVRNQGKFYVINLPTSKVSFEKAVDVSGLKFILHPREEWNQIYNEAWRQMRDFFYVSNMHGVDWPKMREKYAAMLPNVNHRNDLTYLIGELIGELNVGHAYINGGDAPRADRIKIGLLGAEFVKDSGGYFKITKMLQHANWSEQLRSPLAEIGVNAKVGEYLVSIAGKDLKDVPDLFELLMDKAGKTVEIQLSASADGKNARSVLVTPVADESSLYYYDWVQTNIKKVSDATQGKVGYIHIPDMGPEGLNEFVKYFYPQLDKEALIIDDRGNGGGNVSPMIIERLNREITRSNMLRNAEIPTQTPRQMLIGPKVLLINNYSASDGDLFPYAFKKHQLGKVIGQRTWGGVVGIRGSLPFVDGADLRKPEFASYSAEKSEWIIEGYGVEPDIYIENDPAKEYAGEDEQLNKAIEVIKEELKNWTYKQPAIPPAPDKTK